MATGFAFGGPDEQRGMLAAEGIAFDEEGRVLMEEFSGTAVRKAQGARKCTRDRRLGRGPTPPMRPITPPRRPRTSTGKPNWPSTRCTHCETCAAPRPDCKKERHA